MIHKSLYQPRTGAYWAIAVSRMEIPTPGTRRSAIPQPNRSKR
jgi:hypothetical protein